MSSLGSELYTDSANLGRFTSTIGMYIFFFIGVIMILRGIIVYGQSPKIDQKTGKLNNPGKDGLVLMGFGVAFVLMGYLNYYLSKKYKMYAAGQGVGDVVNLIR